jgi:hypothetical protein
LLIGFAAQFLAIGEAAGHVDNGAGAAAMSTTAPAPQCRRAFRARPLGWPYGNPSVTDPWHSVRDLF